MGRKAHGKNRRGKAAWGEKVRLLKEYKEKNGNYDVPKDHDLGPWVSSIKRKYGMIMKNFPELLEDSKDATSPLPSCSSAGCGHDDAPKKKKKKLSMSKTKALK